MVAQCSVFVAATLWCVPPLLTLSSVFPDGSATVGMAVGIALRNVKAANEQDLMFMAGSSFAFFFVVHCYT